MPHSLIQSLDHSVARPPPLRTLKWTTFVTILVAIIAVVLYLRRDWIVTGAANTLLADLELVVSELQVSSLGVTQSRLDQLVIDGSDGSRYTLSNVLIVYGPAGERIRAVIVDEATVTPGKGDSRQAGLNDLLQTILELPETIPNSIVRIARLQVSDLPQLESVEWATPNGEQYLSVTLSEYRLALTARRTANGGHEALVDVTAGTQSALHMKGTLVGEADEFVLAATYDIESMTFLRLLAEFQSLALDVATLDATANGEVHARVADNIIAWRIDAEALTVTMSFAPLNDLPINIDDLVCESGGHCSFVASLSNRALNWGGYTIDAATVSLPMDIEFNGGTRSVHVLPAATGSFVGIRTLDMAAAEVQLTSFSGAELTMGDAWQTTIDELAFEIERFTGAGALVATLPLTVLDLAITESGDRVGGSIALQSAAKLQWGETELTTPIVDGLFSIEGKQLSSALTINDMAGGLAMAVELNRDLATGEGTLVVDDASLQFAQSRLSSLFADWEYPFDVVGGQWRGNLSLEWVSDGDEASYTGVLKNSFSEIAGAYNDIAFTGASSSLNVLLDSAAGISAAPATLSVALVDIGLPIEAISAGYAVDLEHEIVEVANLSGSVLGGKAVADPFLYSVEDGFSDIHLRLQSIQLQSIVDLADFEDVEVSGAVSGGLPISATSDAMIISNGHLVSDGMGGVIRYGTEDDRLKDAAANSNFAIVTQSLNNFEFDSLASVVNYDESGDLLLEMRLSGINPEVDATQPIILNLSVENNVPQLLKSLQAVRSIEDILEQRSTH